MKDNRHPITIAEDELFDEWAEKFGYGDLFIQDGVPCPDNFEKAKHQITFVLKEAHSSVGWDMRNWIDACGAKGEGITWNNVTRWTQAILERGEYLQNISTEDRKHWLRQISFLNLKKEGGGRSANHTKIEEYARKEKDFIRRQLIIYQPDIIICCGKNVVAEWLYDFVFKHKNQYKDWYNTLVEVDKNNWKMQKTDWENSYEKIYYDCCNFYKTTALGKETVVLNCYHPQYQGFNRKIFDAINTIAQKVLPVRAEK